MEGIRLGNLDEERKVAIRVRSWYVSDRDGKKQPEHVLGAVRKLDSRFGLTARELCLVQLQPNVDTSI